MNRMTFLPRQEVDQWDCDGVARHQWIPETMFYNTDIIDSQLGMRRNSTRKALLASDILQCRGFPEGEGLDGVDVVPVVAGDPCQARLPQLHQLRLRERLRACI